MISYPQVRPNPPAPDGWLRGLHVSCPRTQRALDGGPCDCGYHGPWDWRPWVDLDDDRDGWEERCPRCGDVERWQRVAGNPGVRLIAEIRATEPTLFDA